MESKTLDIKEGKAKKLYWDGISDTCNLEFKDSLTALNGQKKLELNGKGIVSASITTKLFNFLNGQKIPTHFEKPLSANTVQVKRLKMIPLEVIVRNYAAGSLCKRLGIEQGSKLKKPMVQFHLKDDALNDPLLSESEIFELGIVDKLALRDITNKAIMINWLLSDLFKQAEILLVDFKLEFGFDKNDIITLGDELSPDNMRLWSNCEEGNEEPLQKLDKDRFREGLGEVLENYQIVLDKLNDVLMSPKPTEVTPAKINLFIYPQPGLLDPTGRALTTATGQLGFAEVSSIRAGKFLSLDLKDFRSKLVEELCERILVSPASESYDFEIIP